MSAGNLFHPLPAALEAEVFEDLVRSSSVRIERIVSPPGHRSPESGWYDQDENEWVIVLRGGATLEFEHGATHALAAGEYLNIPAHARHRVASTAPDEPTLWLAVFYA